MSDEQTKTVQAEQAQPQSARPNGAARGLQPLASGTALQAYTVQNVLGTGGFGVTYLARDNHLQHLVAIKEYLPTLYATRGDAGRVEVRNEDFLEPFTWGRKQFLKEAQTLARFKHPNIVRVLTFFEDNNTAYFVMDYEQGESFKEIMEKEHTLEESRLLNIVLPLLDGLEELQDAGFIHRDIKPGNIYIRQDGSPVLLDFGAALDANTVEEAIGRTLLTPGYAPPEQYDKDPVRQGPWTDIYAMGAVLYRGVTGKKPIAAHLRQEAENQGEPDPLLPAEKVGAGTYSQPFLKAVDRALSMEESARPQDVRQWKAMLYQSGYDTEEEETGAFSAAETMAAVMPELSQSMREETVDVFKTVLIAGAAPEHIRQDQTLLQRALKVRVKTAQDGKAAVRLMKEGGVDLILCDAALQDMDALQFLDVSHKLFKHHRPPVALVTGNAKKHFLLDAIAAGIAGYLVRPATQEGLEWVLRQVRQVELFNDVEETQLDEAVKTAEAKRYPQAIELFKEIIFMEEEAQKYGEPSYLEYYTTGMRELAASRFGKAIVAFIKADKIIGLLADAYTGLAEANKSKGDMDEYVKHAKQAVTQGRRIELLRRSRKLLVDTIKTDTEHQNPLNTLGVRLRKEKDYEGAVRAFTSALELTPNEPVIYFNLAKTLAYKRDAKTALEMLNRALTYNPVFKEAAVMYTRVTGKPWTPPSKTPDYIAERSSATQLNLFMDK